MALTSEQANALDAYTTALAGLVDEMLAASPQEPLSLPLHVFGGYLASIRAKRQGEPDDALRAARSIIGDSGFVVDNAFFEQTDRPETLWTLFQQAQAAARAIPSPPVQLERWPPTKTRSN